MKRSDPFEDDGGFTSVTFMLLLMALMTTGGYLVQGIGAEKENRVIEVLLATVKPQEILAGIHLDVEFADIDSGPPARAGDGAMLMLKGQGNAADQAVRAAACALSIFSAQ